MLCRQGYRENLSQSASRWTEAKAEMIFRRYFVLNDSHSTVANHWASTMAGEGPQRPDRPPSLPDGEAET